MEYDDKILRAILNTRAYARQNQNADLLTAADLALSTALREISSLRLTESRESAAQFLPTRNRKTGKTETS